MFRNVLRWLPVAVLALAACGGAAPPPVEPAPEPGQVYVDSSEILLMESYPVEVVLLVRGHLPTPCHALLSQVSGPDAEGRIEVTLTSEAPPDVVCAQVLEPFEERILLGSYTDGDFTVWLNGEPIVFQHLAGGGGQRDGGGQKQGRGTSGGMSKPGHR